MNIKNIIEKTLHFPLTKIIIGIIFMGLTITYVPSLTKKTLNLANIDNHFISIIKELVTAILLITSYIYLFKFYEKRDITEFSKKRVIKNLTIGIVLGTILQSLTILVIYLKGGYSIISINPISFIILPLIMAIKVSIIEEILFRGILFRITEEKLGSYIALIISALIFGALHFLNPNSSLSTTIIIALNAGLLLGVAYIYLRNLWFPIALHFAWNFTQTTIFGANTSGISASKTLIISKIEGAEWFTGGVFGPENSIQATVFSLLTFIILLYLSQKKGNVIKPYWNRITKQ